MAVVEVVSDTALPVRTANPIFLEVNTLDLIEVCGKKRGRVQRRVF